MAQFSKENRDEFLKIMLRAYEEGSKRDATLEEIYEQLKEDLRKIMID